MQRFWLILILTFSTVSYSQSFSLGSLVSEMNKKGFIEGVIIDNDNNKEPLPFVDITIKNLQLTTVSEIDGSYSIQLKPGVYTLIFSFIGYKTIEVKNIKIASNKKVNFNQIMSSLKIESDVTSISSMEN
ncbi:MAG: carboxypeptidase-like regulatory domain-containing protein [Lutibacter sp.]|nr:carboxypeptidase-like regulatory domain-containing protein [Lutibacter sp.]